MRLHLTMETIFDKLRKMKDLHAHSISLDLFLPIFVHSFVKGKGHSDGLRLSGDPEDIYKTDEVILREFSDNVHLCNWIRMAQEKIQFQGLPSRICWLGYGERARFGKIINDMVAVAN